MNPALPSRLSILSKYALTIAILPMPLVAMEVFRIAGKSIVLPHLAWIPAILLGIFLHLTNQNCSLQHFRRFRHLHQHDMCFIAFAGWALGSSMVEDLMNPGFNPGLKPYTQFGYLLFMFIGYKALESIFRANASGQNNTLVPACRLLVTAGSITALLALTQYAAYHLNGRVIDLFRGANIYAHYIPNSLSSPISSGVGRALSFPASSFSFRSFASFPEPTFMAHFLTLSLLLINLAKVGRAAGFLMLLHLGGLIVSLSRTGWAATTLALAVYIALNLAASSDFSRKKDSTKPGTLLFLALIPGLLICGTYMINRSRLTSLDDLSVHHRLATLQTSLRALAHRPTAGHGLGSSDTVTARYMSDGHGIGYRHGGMNSIYPQILTETGAGGFIFFTLFFLLLCNHCRGNPPLLSAIVATAIYWMGHSAINWTFIWLIIALASAFPTLTSLDTSESGN
ncbi:MAG: hypothetical protein CVV64_14750 [Candidatus Wallbacteria bacterium HGW-Wallbacteria-1]|jgi:hypothetical protein|uniref:O-antigen ligase-related domain-containing protein n=1 Tax=Candidatus Wallbacteria bacterium HGW-Wallbacteria-1 TaxID=2013854 RepID=A0A2N1PLW6_9BACT|nr:MAG: hypothetical protein CVV64_14750 [Candidatus Wallbacteria bacterium HGW-Wallbacteria-1]